jgi:hypothetical protein
VKFAVLNFYPKGIKRVVDFVAISAAEYHAGMKRLIEMGIGLSSVKIILIGLLKAISVSTH